MGKLILTPNIQPLFDNQKQLMELAFKHKVQRIFGLAGRGWGKSIMGMTGAFIAGTRYCKNGRITLTYPTYRDCIDVGKAKLFEVFPIGSFSWKESELTATLRYTNTKIALRSRDIKNSNRTGDIGRGPTNGLVIHDEPAMDSSPKSCHAFNASVRGPGALGVWYITTPKVGWLREEVKKFQLDNVGWGVHQGEHLIADPVTGEDVPITGAVIHARTLDNPYGGRELHTHMLSDLDEKWAKQELDGLWVSMGGLLWDNFEWSPWPNGNVANIAYSHHLPWYLSCDFGVSRSSWIVWQKHKLNGIDLHVAVREYHPSDEGVLQSLERIKRDMKTKPSAIFSGHDHKTRAVANSSLTPSFYVGKIWGGTPIRGLGGLSMDKSIRHATMRAFTHSADGQRRFALSSSIDGHDPERRGIRAVLEQDEYGDGRDIMKKDGFLEHCRDALHHYFSAVDAPTVGRDRRYA